MFNDILKRFCAARAEGGVKKNVHFQRGKNVHMVGNISAYTNVSALRAVGGDVEIFRTKFLGGDRDEKIDFPRITSDAP